jgi:hypothetical protein
VGLNIDTPWTAAATVVTELIDRFVPDKAEAAKEKLAAVEAIQAAQAGQIAASVTVDQAQTAVNLAEAQNRSLWVNGGRPAVIWICALGLLYSTFAGPVLSWVMTSLRHWPPAPAIDLATLLTLLGGLLGLSTQRTIERINGVIPPGK